MSREKRTKDKERKNAKRDVLRDQSQFHHKKASKRAAEVGQSRRDQLKEK